MSDIVPTAEPVVVTIPNVELMSVGTWEASTGTVEMTPEKLRAAVDAFYQDEAVLPPRIKIGHTDPRFSEDSGAVDASMELLFDGDPAIGKVINLRLSDDDQTLLGDLVGVPKWLADILPYAYPSRSIEGFSNGTTGSGQTHAFVLTAVSLLGVEAPAVETLEDIPLLFGTEAPTGTTINGELIAATKGVRMAGEPVKVNASVSYDDIYNAFYDEVAVGDQWSWWLWEVYTEPRIVIAQGSKFYALTYEINGDTVTFGEPTEVRVQYAEVEGGKVVASVAKADAQVKRFTKPKVNAKQKEGRMSSFMEKLRAKFGLPADADEDAILAAADAQSGDDPGNEPAPAPASPPSDDDDEDADDLEDGDDDEGNDDEEADAKEVASGLQIPDGYKLVSEDTIKSLQTSAKKADEMHDDATDKRRNAIVSTAVAAGKFPPAESAKFRADLDKDEALTASIIDRMPEGIVPMSERGTAKTAAAGSSSGQNVNHLFPELAEKTKED